MLRLGGLLLALFLALEGLVGILDHFHVVNFGPCAGSAAALFYVALMVTSGFGTILTLTGSIAWLARRYRDRH
jgi:hypothetical protein